MGVVIVEAVRTPIGRFQGALSGVRPDDLLSIAIREVVRRAGVEPAAIDEVVMGCANQAGEDNRNVARMATLLAGLPHDVPAMTVNRLCASGLEAVNTASRQIRAGDGQIVVAGGVESMSRAPYSLPRGPQHPKAGNFTAWDTSLGWRYPNPKLEALFPLEAMGDTAENVAARYEISRADQDAFAARSHQRAVAAWSEGRFAPEIVAVETPDGLVERDEGPRSDTSVEKLARLKPAFRKDGSVTAGNASPLNDGAAALVLADEAHARALGLRVRARIVASASAGVDPRYMGMGPVPATRTALTRAGLAVADIDVWELNEAFAAQALAVVRELGIDPDRVNRHGGAIAIGHPLGASGARILTTLIGVLERSDGRYGAASLCVGVGQGVTTIIEKVDS